MIRLWLNKDMLHYLFRCWPLMPPDWIANDDSDYKCFNLEDEQVEELSRYINLDLRYSMSDDDDKGQALTVAKRAFIFAQLLQQGFASDD